MAYSLLVIIFLKATTPVSESTQSTRSVPERYANISKSESEITNVYAPSYSIITTTDSHSDVQLEDESLKEAASVDGGIGDIVMPERTEVRMLIVVLCFDIRAALLPKASGLRNYKFISDNVDKNVKPSFQRDKLKGKSHHCVHGYSVQDRIDTSLLSD